MFLFDKTKSKYFYKVKSKKKKCLEKTPSTIRRKNQALLMCFQKNLQIILRKKKNPRHAGKDYQYHFTI